MQNKILLSIILFSILCISACNEKSPTWITEGVVQGLEFGGNKPFQVFNISTSDNIATALAVAAFEKEKALDVEYFLDGGDTARVHVYTFSHEIDAFGVFKKLGGNIYNKDLSLHWYKNAVFIFKLNRPSLFNRELIEFQNMFLQKTIPDIYAVFPLRDRIKGSESVSNEGVLNSFTSEKFVSIDYRLNGEVLTLARTFGKADSKLLETYLLVNKPLKTDKFEGYYIYLIEQNGFPLWITEVDGYIFAVFGQISLLNGLELLKKSLNIQKILN